MAINELPFQGDQIIEDQYITEIVSEELSDGTTVYVASHPELEGCMAHGETEQEARENLHEAFTLMVSHLRRYDLPIPAPTQRPVQRIAVQSYIPGAGKAFVLFTVVSSGQPGSSVSRSDMESVSSWVQERLYITPPSAVISQPNVKPAIQETR